MINGKTVLAIIPARGGSKGIPRKNIREVGGKPLIAWTIEQSLASKYLDKVIVSTDDIEIAETSKKYGAGVPFLRPKELSKDEAKGIDVILHAIDWMVRNDKPYDLVMLLQPTSPLRTVKHIDSAIELLLSIKAQAIVSVCEVEHHPYWTNVLPSDGSMKDFLRPEAVNKNRQDLPIFYRLNGAIYLAYCKYLIKWKTFVGNDTYAYIMPKIRSIDIDNIVDFNFAEFLLNKVDNEYLTRSKSQFLFDRTKLKVNLLSERKHDLDIEIIKPLYSYTKSNFDKKFKVLAKRIVNARKNGSSTILMMGGHVIRAGVQNYLIDLMERGYISCLAMNGSGIIHDFEFALIGATTENVTKYIREGQFGLWTETGRINDIINQGYKEGLGMGEAIGQAIFEGSFPFKNNSLMATGYRLKIPITVHVGIGYDIIHEHPNCDGAATGATSYRDFLCFAKIVENLEGGVVMNFGSAVMAPEVFLKALSMARNVAHQRGKAIKRFSTLVCDLQELPDDYSKEPPKDSSAYYFRPLKTMLVRTVADGGESFYVKGNHSDTIPALWMAINDEEKIIHENTRV